MNLPAIWQAVRARVLAFLDPTAWLIFLFTIAPILVIDRPMGLTVIQWSALGVAFAGITVMLSRAMLPHIDLKVFVEKARDGNLAASIVVAAVALFMALVFLGLVLWGKA